MFAVPLAASAVLSTTAQAQQITTEINGQVNNPAGEPLADATIVITDTRTGATATISANQQGYFSARNLSTGGPYTVTATAPDFQGQTVNDITTSLQGATQLSFTLSAVSAEASSETIVVTGARARITQLATGPGSSFGADALESAPTRASASTATISRARTAFRALAGTTAATPSPSTASPKATSMASTTPAFRRAARPRCRMTRSAKPRSSSRRSMSNSVSLPAARSTSSPAAAPTNITAVASSNIPTTS